MRDCERCGGFLWKEQTCACRPFVVEQGCDGDERTVYGFDKEDVALKWAQKYNQDDYPLMNDEETIWITDEHGARWKYAVGAELHYWAAELEMHNEELGKERE